MDETSKTRKIWTSFENSLLSGKGIDIGCGPDPINVNARRFDIEDGDANSILNYVHDEFDFVYSSHCLEHMFEPRKTLLDWWALVKPGGYLFIIVPDEDLYEQGVFPSRFNPDHKSTFTISKTTSWSPVSINMMDLILSHPNAMIIDIALQDQAYDRRLLYSGNDKASKLTKLTLKAYGLFQSIFSVRVQAMEALSARFTPIDQTLRPNVLAQIQCVIRKVV